MAKDRMVPLAMDSFCASVVRTFRGSPDEALPYHALYTSLTWRGKSTGSILNCRVFNGEVPLVHSVSFLPRFRSILHHAFKSLSTIVNTQAPCLSYSIHFSQIQKSPSPHYEARHVHARLPGVNVCYQRLPVESIPRNTNTCLASPLPWRSTAHLRVPVVQRAQAAVEAAFPAEVARVGRIRRLRAALPP